jgi:hypothetical protein
MVADLDAAVPREGARVHLSQYGGGPDESKLVANQRGYLRLGVELMRAAFAHPSPKSPELIEVDLKYLLTEDSTVGFDWFERREDLSAPKPQHHAIMSRLVPVAIVGILLVALALVVIGFGTVISWMTK